MRKGLTFLYHLDNLECLSVFYHQSTKTQSLRTCSFVPDKIQNPLCNFTDNAIFTRHCGQATGGSRQHSACSWYRLETGCTSAARLPNYQTIQLS